MSFRGFVDELRDQADGGQAAEAPILEEGSDGVRLMTAHKAKGLEFPVVVLADMTAKLSNERADRLIDKDRNACYLRLGRWTPVELAAKKLSKSPATKRKACESRMSPRPGPATCWSCRRLAMSNGTSAGPVR